MYAKNTNITGAIWMVNVGIYIYIYHTWSIWVVVPCMVVSWNRGTPSSHPFLDGIFPYEPTSYWGPPWLWKPPYNHNRGTPKSSILVGCSLINQPFWGTSIVGSLRVQPLKTQGLQNLPSIPIAEGTWHSVPRLWDSDWNKPWQC